MLRPFVEHCINAAIWYRTNAFFKSSILLIDKQMDRERKIHNITFSRISFYKKKKHGRYIFIKSTGYYNIFHNREKLMNY